MRGNLRIYMRDFGKRARDREALQARVFFLEGRKSGKIEFEKLKQRLRLHSAKNYKSSK